MSHILLDEDSNKFFIRKVIRISTPIALAQLMTSLLGIIDMFMVSNLGNLAVEAVGVSANFAFLLSMIEFGFFSGLAIFIAQYWGSKEINNIHKVFIISLIIGAIVSSLFFIFAFFAPETLIGIFDHNTLASSSESFKQYGSDYLKIVAFSYFSMTITFAVGMLMRSVEKVGYPQIVTIGVVVLNTFLNYVLINGNLGFNAMGVRGAALATTVSSTLGALFLIGYLVFSKEAALKIKFKEYRNITRNFIKKIFKKALPVAINETIWGLGMSFYLIAYAFIGEEIISSIVISNLIMGLFWSFNAGLSTACAIMLGKKLGENKLELAKQWGINFTKLGVLTGIVFGGLLFVFSTSIASTFKHLPPNVITNISLILKVFSFYIPIKFTNVVHIVGTLRSGGDTVYSLLAEIVPLWLIGVPLAFILSIYSTLPIYWIVAIVNVEEIIKLFLLLWRFFSYKWVKNLTIS